MFYLANGELYARDASGKRAYARMEIHLIDGYKSCVRVGGGLDVLPPGSIPLTIGEVFARFPAKEPPKPRKKKGGDTEDVSDK